MRVIERCIHEWDHFEARAEDNHVVYDVYQDNSGGWVAAISLDRKASDGLTVWDVVRGFPTADDARQHAISALRQKRVYELADFVIAP